MFKSLLALKTVLFFAPLALPLTGEIPAALAIAPGVNQAQFCQEYVADRFRVTLDDVSITAWKKTGSNFKVDWTIPDYRGRGYCLISAKNQMVRFEVERRPSDRPTGNDVDEKRFGNLPGYGDVIVTRGQRTRGDKQYFLLRPVNRQNELQWYARCGSNADQVYDHRGKYVGYDRRLTPMFPFVCAVSPLGNNIKPQPR